MKALRLIILLFTVTILSACGKNSGSKASLNRNPVKAAKTVENCDMPTDKSDKKLFCEEVSLKLDACGGQEFELAFEYNECEAQVAASDNNSNLEASTFTAQTDIPEQKPKEKAEQKPETKQQVASSQTQSTQGRTPVPPRKATFDDSNTGSATTSTTSSNNGITVVETTVNAPTSTSSKRQTKDITDFTAGNSSATSQRVGYRADGTPDITAGYTSPTRVQPSERPRASSPVVTQQSSASSTQGGEVQINRPQVSSQRQEPRQNLPVQPRVRFESCAVIQPNPGPLPSDNLCEEEIAGTSNQDIDRFLLSGADLERTQNDGAVAIARVKTNADGSESTVIENAANSEITSDRNYHLVDIPTRTEGRISIERRSELADQDTASAEPTTVATQKGQQSAPAVLAERIAVPVGEACTRVDVLNYMTFKFRSSRVYQAAKHENNLGKWAHGICDARSDRPAEYDAALAETSVEMATQYANPLASGAKDKKQCTQELTAVALACMDEVKQNPSASSTFGAQ